MPLPLPPAYFYRLCIVTLVLGLGLVRLFLPDLWARPAFRAALVVFVLLGVGAMLAVAVGPNHAWPIMRTTLLVLTVVLPALFTLPLVALVRRRAVASSPATPGAPMARRAILECAAATLPATAGVLSVGAIRTARAAPALPHLPFAVSGLPPALEGLRILQLTDLHLGLDRTLGDLEALLDRAARVRPDLVVITGDLADDVALIAPATRLVAQLRPRLGVFAILGNHEYHPGIAATLRAFDRGAARLLVDTAAVIPVGASRLALLGIDDPLRSHGAERFFRERIDRAQDGVPRDAVRLLLSHRPEAFDAAAAAGVPLTLAGHTHGGQVAVGGRALVERVGIARYPYGRYVRGEAQLYTSAGFGHWLPWRAGCLAEAPLIVLARA